MTHLLNCTTLKTPCSVQNVLLYILYQGSFSQFCVKIPKFSLPWQQGSVSNILFSAPYVEAMFQIWWRSVHKWRHSVDHRRHRTSETGDRTRKWFYILSNAMHCIRQTITRAQQLTFLVIIYWDVFILPVYFNSESCTIQFNYHRRKIT